MILEDGFTYDTITLINYNTEIVSFIVDEMVIVGQSLGVLPPSAPMTCEESFEKFFISSSLIVYEENLNPVFSVRTQEKEKERTEEERVGAVSYAHDRALD